MTTTAYKPLSVAEKIFKDLVWDPGVKSGELALEGSVPFLALPVIKEVDEFILEELSDWLFGNFILLVDLTAIKLVNAAHQAEYTKASINLASIAHAKGIDSNEFVQAREQAKIDLSKFTTFGKQ